MKRELVNWKISQRNLSREKSQISKRMENTEERLRHMEDAYKRYNIYLIVTPEGKVRDIMEQKQYLKAND